MTLTPTVKLSEQSQEIKKLALEGKTLSAIAATTSLRPATVRYQISLLRKLKQIPYARSPKAPPVPGRVRVDGILSAPVEELRVVTCPQCKVKIQVLG